MGCRAGGIPAVLHKIVLHRSSVVANAVAQHGRPFAVKVNQFFGHSMTFCTVGMQQACRAAPLQNSTQLPAEVKSILHGHIHALACFGAVRVTGIARNKNTGQAGRYLIGLQVVKSVTQTLSNFVYRPPGHLLDVECVGMKNALRSGNQLFKGDVAPSYALVLGEFVHLYVDANHVAAFSRNDQQATLAG